MEHLRLLGVADDGSHLLLEGLDGTPYALPLDERVHAAMRGDRARLGQLQIELENQITPREIQARIRAGQTSEEIALAAQVPVERVARYEGPVLLERGYIAELAQATNVRRVTDASAHPLSDLVVERLQARGVDPADLEWDARRREDGRWAVRLDYLHGGRSRTAVWLFDHQRRTLEPHDDEAGWLMGDERAVPEPDRARRARSRRSVIEPDPPVVEPEDDEPSGPHLTAVPDMPDTHQGPPVEDQPGSTTTALPDEVTTADAGEHGVEEAGEPDHPLRPTTQPRAPSRSKRASVPSWDEILFGGSTPPED